MLSEKVNPIPNILTLTRLVAGLIMFVLLAGVSGGIPFLSTQLQSQDMDTMMRWAFYAFVLGAITDFFDGYFARKLHAESTWGAILDPIADKILVCGTILGLLALGPQTNISLPSALILFREFAVSALREAAAGRGASLKVSQLAKWKTVFQLLALGALLLVQCWSAFNLDIMMLTAFNDVAFWLIWIAAILTLWTGVEYFLSAQKDI